MSTYKNHSQLPRTPIAVISLIRRIIARDLIEHIVITQDSKQWLGKWLDAYLKKMDLQDIDQRRILGTEKPPFVARCGRVLLLVDEVIQPDPNTKGFILLRGTLIEGLHFDDRGDYGPGDRVTIGPITNYWRRITLPKPKRS
jgi:hypothetical protein